MLKNKRKGIALITVVLISALLLVSIVGITIKLVPESKIISGRSLSERALVVAESGMSQTIFDIRNTDLEHEVVNPSGVFHYLNFYDVDSILTSNEVLPFKEQEYSSGSPGQDIPYATYQVKFKNLGDIVEGIKVGVYSLGTIYSDDNKSQILARKVIYSEWALKYTYNSSVFDYAIFSGQNINFQANNAKEIGGNIFADGDITSSGNKTIRVVEGEAYSAGTISPNLQIDYNGDGFPDSPDDQYKHPGVPELQMPSFKMLVSDLEYYESYQGLAWAFKTGKYPYGESNSDFPNTSLLASIIQSPDYLGTASADPSTEPGSSINGILSFYNDLMNDAGGFAGLKGPLYDAREALKSKIQCATFFVNEDEVDIKKETDAHGIENAACRGIIAIKGNLTINANFNISDQDPVNSSLVIVVGGYVELASGNASVDGMIYVNGWYLPNGNNKSPESFFGTGSFSCTGSLVCSKDVNLTGSADQNNTDVSVTYKPLADFPNLKLVTGSDYSNHIDTVNLTPNSWREKSFDEFNDPY